jgi:hypothetical protein
MVLRITNSIKLSVSVLRFSFLNTSFQDAKQWIKSRKPIILSYFSFSSEDLVLSSVMFALFVVKNRVTAGS